MNELEEKLQQTMTDRDSMQSTIQNLESQLGNMEGEVTARDDHIQQMQQDM